MYPGQSDAVRKLFRENFQTCNIYINNSATPTFTNANIIDGSLTLTRTGIPGASFEFGIIGSSTLTFEVANFDHRFDGITFENNTLTMEISVTGPNNTYTMKMGKFFVTDSVNMRTKIRITAQDFSAKLDTIASNVSTTNNTLAEIGALCLSRCNLTLASGISFSNLWPDDLVLTPPPDGKYTYRDILSMILECSFIWGYMDWDGKFRFAGPGNTGQTFGKDVVMDKSDTFGKETIAIPRLRIDDVVYGTSQTGYIATIKNNMFATEHADTIGNQWEQYYTQTFGFRPFSFNCKSVPYIWPLDGINCTSQWSLGWYTFPGCVVYKLNGLSSLSIKAPTETQESMSLGSSFTSAQNAELKRAMPKIYDAAPLDDLTIGSNGYVQFTKPASVQNKQILSVGVTTWTSNTGAFSVIQMADNNSNAYLVGTPGVVVRGLKLRWVYLQ